MNVTILIVRRVVYWTIPCALSLALVVISASSASASFMAPGASLLASPEPDPVGGIVVGTTGPVPFATASYSGTLDSTVISGDVTNPFGGLTFTYLLTNSAVSSGEIDRLSVNDYAGFLVDASYQVPTAGLPPTLMNRSGLGDVVGFTYVGAPIGSGVLTPGSSSALMVVQTNATLFAPTLASVLNGVGTMVSSLGPAVPEPCSVVLAGLGMVAVVCVRLRGRSRRA
jgi:hypothetical protein